MNESIIAGVLTGSMVGITVAAVGAWVGYKFRRKEMHELWAEEQRRRKSDRRRELYERELKIVGDSIHRVVEAMTRGFRLVEPRLSVELVAQADGMMLESKTVVDSFGDPELTRRWHETMNNFQTWWKAIDFDAGTEVELAERAVQTQMAASAVLRRIREILEEV